MKSRRTPSSNSVFRLQGGTEDNDLHAHQGVGYPHLVENDPAARSPYIASVWEPSVEERAALATGANVELVILGNAQPPVIVTVTREQPLSRPARALDVGEDDPHVWAELRVDLVDSLCRAVEERLEDLRAIVDRGAADDAERHEREILVGFHDQMDRALQEIERTRERLEGPDPPPSSRPVDGPPGLIDVLRSPAETGRHAHEATLA